MEVRNTDIIEKKYILLDWNVIKYLKNPRNSTDEELKTLINNLRPKYEFPFCESHLRDLATSYSPENRDRIDDDISFFKELSHETVIAYDNEKFFLVKNNSINNLFNEILAERSEIPNFTAETAPQITAQVDMNKLNDNHPLSDVLSSTHGQITPALMADFFNDSFEKVFSEKNFYKNFRDCIQNLPTNMQQFIPDNLSDQDVFVIKHSIPFLKALEIQTEDELKSVWKDVIFNWMQMKYPPNSNIPFDDLVTTSYTMLDLHPLFQEKLKNNKNTLSNIVRDSKIALYASGAKYFITEDKSCYKKIKFIFQIYNVNCHVLKISEFVQRFNIV